MSFVWPSAATRRGSTTSAARSKKWCRRARRSSCAAARSPGWRWKDDAPFDADGPGTSDLDLTLVGDAALAFFKATGFFVPGVHSRPLSDDDPDIAPDLVPLRQALMDMVRRPVNIQASREIVIRCAATCSVSRT